MAKYLWLDTETTGLDPVKNGIIELACLVEIGGEVVETRLFQMNPVGKEVTEEALTVNKKSIKDIASYPRTGEVKKQVEQFLSRYINKFDKADKFVLAGFNVEFDKAFLEQLWKDQGDVYFYSWAWRQCFDVLDAQHFLEWLGKVEPPGDRKLETLCGFYGVTLDRAHSALSDITATREVALKMMSLIGGKNE